MYDEYDDYLNEKLTERELEILQLIQEGKSNNEIATNLYITVHTVKIHVNNILKKLNDENPPTAGAAFPRKPFPNDGGSSSAEDIFFI